MKVTMALLSAALALVAPFAAAGADSTGVACTDAAGVSCIGRSLLVRRRGASSPSEQSALGHAFPKSALFAYQQQEVTEAGHAVVTSPYHPC